MLRSRPEPRVGCRRSRASGTRLEVLFGDASLLAGERQAHALGHLDLDLAQHHNNLLWAYLPTSGHPGLLWFELILSISPAQKQPVRSGPACGEPIEIWFCDEARVGQKNKITRRWAKRGTRPSAPKNQRTQSAYIFGAICPAHGKGAGLVLPRCTSEGMSLHLKEVSQVDAPEIGRA